jgi:hypothetical protein
MYMEQEVSKSKNMLLLIVAIVMIFIAAYLLPEKYRAIETNQNLSTVVLVENTREIHGVLPVPSGFPKDIPIENQNIVDSSTTYHPIEDIKQFYVSYLSEKGVAEKFNLYREYMIQAGYILSEEKSKRSLSGTKGNSTLYVNLGERDGKTLVELSFLSK